MKHRYIAMTLLSLASGAYAAGSSELLQAASEGTVCAEPRPEVCTMDYVPVCATLQDASRKTYSNGCSACADAEVKSWVADACPE